MRAGEVDENYRLWPPQEDLDYVNVGTAERWLSAISGALIAVYGIRRRSVWGAFLTAIGGSLVYRGATGHCICYSDLGINTADDDTKQALSRTKGIRIEEAIPINRPVEEILEAGETPTTTDRTSGRTEKQYA